MSNLDSTKTSYYYWRGDELYLHLYVTPRAKRSVIVGEYDARLKVQIAAPPNDGKANACLIKFLAAQFAVPQKNIMLMQGECSQHKLVKIKQPQVAIEQLLQNKIHKQR